MTIPAPPLVTPDGRYIVVRGRLWRRSDPRLSAGAREAAVKALMDARRGVATARRQQDPDAEARAHQAADTAKHALGERGPTWWPDESPDLTRHLARTTCYADWYAAQSKL